MKPPHFIRWWRYRWQLRRRARRQAEADTRRRHPAYQGRIVRDAGDATWSHHGVGGSLDVVMGGWLAESANHGHYDPDIPSFVLEDR